MSKVSLTFPTAQLEQFGREAQRQIERAALAATDRAARTATKNMRAAMRGARLGGLANVIGATSDQRKAGRVYRVGTGFSASGTVFVRSKSDRTLGAIESYTEGASIRPVKGRWLWIPTRDIPARAGRSRMTPALYRANGFENRIGPLIFVRGKSRDEAFLMVENVTLRSGGQRGSARRRKSRVSASRVARDKIVAFIGIRQTSRHARVNVTGILDAAQAELPELFAEAVSKR